MALMFAICNPQPNWMPRKPKLMFQICQNVRGGLSINFFYRKLFLRIINVSATDATTARIITQLILERGNNLNLATLTKRLTEESGLPRS